MKSPKMQGNISHEKRNLLALEMKLLLAREALCSRCVIDIEKKESSLVRAYEAH